MLISSEVATELLAFGGFEMPLLAPPQRRLVPVCGEICESFEEQVELFLRGRAFLVCAGVELVHEPNLAHQSMHENAVLAFEVPVDGGACQADGGADLIDADVLVSQFLKEGRCGPRNLLGASAPTCR